MVGVRSVVEEAVAVVVGDLALEGTAGDAGVVEVVRVTTHGSGAHTQPP